MKSATFKTVTLLAAISFYLYVPVLAQPLTTSNSAPSPWQPQVVVNPKLPIQLLLLNQAGIPLVYEPTIGTSIKRQSQVPARGTATINVGVSNQTGDIANILIHSLTELDALHFEFIARDNTILVRIRRAGVQRIDKIVDIDQKGHVYAF